MSTVLWAVRRNDIDPVCYVHYPNEVAARRAFKRYKDSIVLRFPDNHEVWPQLVSSPLVWEERR